MLIHAALATLGRKGQWQKKVKRSLGHAPTQNLKFRDLSAMLCWQERELGEKLTVLQSGCCSALSSQELPAASPAAKVCSMLWL